MCSTFFGLSSLGFGGSVRQSGLLAYGEILTPPKPIGGDDRRGFGKESHPPSPILRSGPAMQAQERWVPWKLKG
jgi:hypothetical protein